ncbi:MAG: formimidoylglutamate deiminase, partial [Parasphingopyxis sp.]
MAIWFETALTPDGWRDGVRVIVEQGRIARVEPGDPRPEDERHRIGIPGLPNLHSHGFQRGMAGLTGERKGEENFWSWREVMYRFVDRLDPEDIAAITAQAYAEMLESGFTHVAEFHYLHNDRNGARYADPAQTGGSIAAAAEASGIGLTLLPVFYAHGDFGGAEPGEGQKRFISDLDGYAELHEASRGKLREGDRLGVAAHSLRAVTPEQLEAIIELGDGPIHIHIAEQTREIEACLAWSGQRPVKWLLDHADVDARWCCIHATHMTDAETEALARSGAVAGLCPITEADLGDGLFPARHFLEAGGTFGVGSDSNVLIDAAGELRLLEYGQRLRDRGHLPHDVAHFVNRLVFCMFAEDVDLLPDHMFTKMLEASGSH